VGSTWGALGNHQKALEMLSKTLEMQKQLFGEIHPDVASVYFNIAQTHLQLKDYFSAQQFFQKALNIYQNHPSYQLHPDTAELHNRLAFAYSLLDMQAKALEHKQKAKKMEQALENQELLKKRSLQLNAFVLNKQYKKAFDLIEQDSKELKNLPEVLCSHMQLSLLCSNKSVVKLRQSLVEQAELMAKNEALPVQSRLKLQMNLAVYWMSQKQWNKVLGYAFQLKQSEADITYEPLDVAYMQESEKVLGETISAHLLGSYLALITYEEKGNLTVVKAGAEQLIEKMKQLATKEIKIQEIKERCNVWTGRFSQINAVDIQETILSQPTTTAFATPRSSKDLQTYHKTFQIDSSLRIKEISSASNSNTSHTLLQLNSSSIAKHLWKNSEALISNEMAEKVSVVASHLKEEGFELCGVEADGDCFLNAFLGSYQTLSKKKIPILDEEKDKVGYLRDWIAQLFLQKNEQLLIRGAEIKQKGRWINSEEGDLLISALSIPIRVITVQNDENGCGFIDMLTMQGRQEWASIPKEHRPQEYIFIIDLGGHFLYAKKRI
jgi:tetratricopeptide (TPR) repeat protein